MAATFEAKEPTAAEHALRLTEHLYKYEWGARRPIPSDVVKAYGELYRGILKALRDGTAD